MKNFVKYFAIGIMALLVGIFLGTNYRGAIAYFGFTEVIQRTEVRETPDGISKLTSPLLECTELPESISDAAINSTKKSLTALIEDRQKSGDIKYASVYFRDLNNGPWFGINESDPFFPASLLKLPLAMSFYDKAEEDSTLLTRELVYQPDSSITSQLQPFAGLDQLEAGKKYTVQYLLDFMLKESSNEAANMLAQFGGNSLIDDVYHNLGLELPKPGMDYSIDTHKYASFFRILYNATYIDRSASEKILKALTDATFSEGLVAGVPKNISVAHKFGTRRVNDSTVQLHDCGIIYAPNRPYILCVMTQGSDFTKLAAFIHDVSNRAYENIAAEPKGK